MSDTYTTEKVRIVETNDSAFWVLRNGERVIRFDNLGDALTFIRTR